MSNLKPSGYLVKEIDIYSKRIYLDNYWDKIPVLLYDEKELFRPFDEDKINKFLD